MLDKYKKNLIKSIKKKTNLKRNSYRIDKRFDLANKNFISLLKLKYRSVLFKPNIKENFYNQEFHVYSQSGEDGLLLYIFSKIGITNCKFVEIGCGNGKTCNTANLSLNFGWQGILIDCEEKNIEIAQAHYKNILVKVIKSFITKENVNEVIEKEINGEIDLLTIDIDGNDLWIWKAINAISPRVVMIEYNASFGHKQITVKYDPEFKRYKKHESGWYYGASLSALTKLAQEKGYVLVGCSSSGVNAFFARQDIAKDKIDCILPEEAYYPHISRINKYSIEEQFEKLKDLEFEHID